MERLTYTEYKGCRDILTIDLHNGYTIIAIKSWTREYNNYYVELKLKRNDVERWDTIEDAESVVFSNDYKTINVAILKHVSSLMDDGFFDKYINRYEYELKCFEIGNDIVEKERLGEK